MGCLLLASSAVELWVLGALTCCPVVVRPLCIWPLGSLPSFLSFALLLPLDVQVTVGSLLPYGSQPSRWGHPYGVEAAVVLDRNEGLVCFSFPSGLILRDGVTLWVETVFDLILDRNVDFSVSLLGWFRPSRWPSQFGSKLAVGFHARSPRWPHFLSLYHCPSGWGTLWLKCVGRFPLVHDRRLSLVLSPISFRMGFEPLSEASLRESSGVLDYLQCSSLSVDTATWPPSWHLIATEGCH